MTVRDAAPIIKKAVTSRQVVEHYGFQPNRAGYICCPFHGEKTASLKVHKSGWYCYGCHQGGDAVEFIRLYEDCSFYAAVRKADEYFSLGLVRAEKVTLDDIYAAKEREKRKRDEQRALSITKTAFLALLDRDWKDCWSFYKDAHSVPKDARNATQWWNMAIAEDTMKTIDYFEGLVKEASSVSEVNGLMARYDKGVFRNDAGFVISGA